MNVTNVDRETEVRHPIACRAINCCDTLQLGTLVIAYCLMESLPDNTLEAEVGEIRYR